MAEKASLKDQEYSGPEQLSLLHDKAFNTEDSSYGARCCRDEGLLLTHLKSPGNHNR